MMFLAKQIQEKESKKGKKHMVRLILNNPISISIPLNKIRIKAPNSGCKLNESLWVRVISAVYCRMICIDLLFYKKLEGTRRGALCMPPILKKLGQNPSSKASQHLIFPTNQKHLSN